MQVNKHLLVLTKSATKGANIDPNFPMNELIPINVVLRDVG